MLECAVEMLTFSALIIPPRYSDGCFASPLAAWGLMNSGDVAIEATRGAIDPVEGLKVEANLIAIGSRGLIGYARKLKRREARNWAA